MPVKLSHINTCLLILIIVVNSYTIVLPLVPRISFWLQFRHNNGERQRLLISKVDAPDPAAISSGDEAASANQLIIPAMLLDQPIQEGADASTLNKGLWHRPLSSTPDKGGNMVIAGHRLTYKNPYGTLYHLDKVKTGDIIGLTWNGVRYRYTVSETKVVSADQTSIEAPTTDALLTIYTCTPLWLPKDRLVVVARLDEGTL